MPSFLKPLTSIEGLIFFFFFGSFVYFVLLCFLILNTLLMAFPDRVPIPALSAVTKHGVRFKCSDIETMQDAGVSIPAVFLMEPLNNLFKCPVSAALALGSG